MILVQGEARFAAGEIDRIRDVLTATVGASRAEAGCEEYSYAVDLSDPNLLHINERWTDEAAIEAHFAQPHVAALQETLATARIETISIRAYRADYLRSLIGA